MENLNSEPLVHALEKCLNEMLKECDELNKQCAEMYEEYSTLISENSQVFIEIAENYTTLPMGQEFAEEILIDHEKILNKLYAEVYKEQQDQQDTLPEFSLSSIEEKFTGKDKFTMMPFEDVVAELSRITETTISVEQELMNELQNMKKEDIATEAYCKEIDSDVYNMSICLRELEATERELIFQLDNYQENMASEKNQEFFKNDFLTKLEKEIVQMFPDSAV